MDVGELRALRLRAQGLRSPRDTEAPAVVERFVAVQAQEYLPAQWGLAARVRDDRRPDAASVARSIDAGAILRTHVLRPTWHFVARGDARWLMELSAERVHRQNGTYYRRLGVEGADAARGLDLLANAVAGGRHRTRAELAEAVAAGGLPLDRLGLTYLVMLGELERVLISGANAGRQRTYAAFDERVPASAPRAREESLVELAKRFIASRGPVTERDFSAWSGFTLVDARRAFAGAADGTTGRVETVEVEGVTHWLDAGAVATATAAGGETAATGHAPGPTVDLLQAYDEYIMGYAAPREYLLPPGRTMHAETALHALVVDGVLAGRWAPVVEPRRATVRIVPWRRMSRAEQRALAASVDGVERFLGLPVTVRTEPVAD